MQHKSFEITMGKREIAHKEQFLLFPVFSTLFENTPPFLSNSKLLSAISFSLVESKICCTRKLKTFVTESCPGKSLSSPHYLDLWSTWIKPSKGRSLRKNNFAKTISKSIHEYRSWVFFFFFFFFFF